MGIARRILRIAGYIGLGLLAIVLVVAVAALYVGGTESGREWLAATIVEQISVPGETEVALSRLEGPLPSTVVLEGIAVADREGTWLTVDRASLEWNPLRLLSGEFSVDLLQADGITVLRSPAPGEPDTAPSQPFQWPTLPVEVDIRKFLATDVELQEPVVGTAARLRVEGEAHIAESGRAVARISAVRTDEAESRIALDATYDPATDILAVSAEATEREGGLIARAMGLNPPPPLDLTFAGEGPLDDWRGQLQGAIGDQAEVAAEVGIRRVDGQLALRIASSLRAPGFTPPAIQPLVGDGMEFLFEGRTTGESSIRIDTLSVRTSALDAAVTADIDLEKNSVAGHAEVLVTDGAALGVLTAPATVTGARLEANFFGPLLQPEIDLVAAAESVGLDQATLRGLTLNLLLKPLEAVDRGPLQASFLAAARIAEIQSEALPPGDLAAPLMLKAEGAVDMAAETASLSSLELSTPTMSVSGTGAADLRTFAAEGSLRLVAASLAPLAPFLGQPIQGSADLSADFSVGEEMRTVEADLRGELRGVTAEGLPLAAILGDLTTLEGKVSTDARGTKSGRIDVNARAGTLIASATMPADGASIDGSYRLTVPQLETVAAAFGVQARGDLALGGNVVGPAADPTVTAALTISGAAVSGQQLGTVRGEARVDSAITAPRGTLQVSAAPPAGPVGLETSFALRDDAVRLDPLRLSVAGSSIAGALTAPTNGAPVSGRLSGDLDRLGPLLAVAGLDGRGSATVDLRLSGDGSSQAVEAEVGLRDLALEAPDGAETTSVDRADATARVVLQASPAGRVSLNAQGITAGGTEVSSLSLEGRGSLADAEVRLDARGQSFAPFTVSAGGTASAAGGGYSLELERLTATVKDERITLATPATLGWRPGGLQVSNLDLRVAGGRVALDADLGAGEFSGSAEIRQLPLSLARLFVPGRDVQGTVSGEATVAGTPQAPTATARLRFDDVRAAAAANVPPVDGVLQADWRSGRLESSLTVSGFSTEPLRASLTAPLRLDAGSMTPVLPENGPLSGNVRWQGEVGPLFLLSPLDDQRLTGMGEIALGLGGTISRPQLTGYVALSGGTFEHLVAGTVIRSLDVRIDAEGRRLVLSRLSATDGGSGRLEGTGAISLAETDPGAEFSIEIDNFIAVRRDDVTAKIDADLAFARVPDGASLSGRVKVEEAEIRLVNQLPPSVVTLDVIERNGGGQQTAAVEAEETLETPDAGPSALKLDLTVSMPERIFVRGRGLDSEWGGEFRITGTADSPRILGDLTSRRGRLSLLNQDFDLEPSTISVSQGNRGEIILGLDIRATAETGDITAVVRVTGTASNPQIQLTSTPELPQDEVLARLLFGRSSAQLTPLEAIELAAAVQELTGSGGPGLLDIGRRFLGVDVLRVTGAGEGETGATVQAGKYVTDEVFVGVEQGTAAQSGAATVEIEVLPNVSVTSKVGQSGDTNVGVKVQWDY